MPSSLLLCFAHPDDESFLTAGAVCRAVEAGIRVALSTATLGESGKAGNPPVCGEAELPAVRERELRQAVAALGISELYLLGYRDKELSAAPPERIREQLVTIIRRERPDVVVTFDPNGGNLHSDHIAICRFTTDAVSAAADPRWLPECGEPHEVRRLAWVPGRRPWEMARDPQAASRGGVDVMVDVSRHLDRKWAALLSHRTQHQSLERNFLNQPDADRLLATEFFRLAWPEPDLRRPLPDLFDGLE